ncbi:nuclear transport factor 2 family protein [Streptomyces sp. ISL-100]|uniref:nuclear transport factor 2 family protein n=1 Tax=Streptomyces sp. ISL-100 TaxID=2819173 RepID=UPI0027E5AA28|nr:nuclear transport factor 2 family protein [Streptomyces sp. ISL-100]
MFEEPVHAFAVRAGDGVPRVVGDGQGKVGGQFEPEDVVVAGERATIRWRYRFGDGPADSVRGVNLMCVRDGLIVEALGYSKTTGDVPLAVDGLDG